jgi:hypothetical protein
LRGAAAAATEPKGGKRKYQEQCGVRQFATLARVLSGKKRKRKQQDAGEAFG